jgi:MFS family permease
MKECQRARARQAVLSHHLARGRHARGVRIVLRLLQGIAMGGEWGGAVVLSSEHAPKGKEIFYSAFAQQGSPAGNLLATVAFLVISTLPDHQFMTWGWRVPFLLSALLVVVGMFIRMSVDESPAMKELQAKNKVAKLPIGEVLRHHKALVAMGVGACVIALSATYFKTTFALSWAVTSIGFDRTQFLSVITFAIVVQLIVQPFGAVLALLRGDGRHACEGVPGAGALYGHFARVSDLRHGVRGHHADSRPVPVERHGQHSFGGGAGHRARANHARLRADAGRAHAE